MSRYELLSLIGAAAAFLVLALWLLRKRSTPAKRRETRPARAEPRPRPDADREPRQPTELRVELVGPPGERRFVFSNTGPAVARNVRFAFADTGGWSAPVIPAQFREVFPIEEFRPNQRVSCIAALHLGHPPVLVGAYSWEDEGGAKYQTTCRIPS